jgi:hypothetical protein
MSDGSSRQHLIERALIWSAMSFLLLLFGMVVSLVAVVLWAAPGAVQDVVKPMVEGRVISRTLALFLVIPTVAALTLLDKINGDTAAAVLSAIAGYVLGASSQAAP